jgi:hypothetical protein
MMLSETSQWHITMPVGGGIHAINKAAVTTNLIFRPRRYQLTAKSYRHARNDASSLWNEYTAEMAA